MDISQSVHKLQAVYGLLEDWADFLFHQPRLFFYESIDMATSGVLSEDIEVLFIMEVAVEADDVDVLESIMNSDFLGYLMFYLFLPHHRFFYNLHCTDKVCILVSI